MNWTTLHAIVTGLLLQRGYPVHFYIDFLVYGMRAFEELHFDVLKNVNVQKITLDDYNEGNLPADYMDIVKAGVPDGQYIRQMSGIALNPTENTDASNNRIPWPGSSGYSSALNTIVFNEHGEFTGRLYGLRGISDESYQVNISRGKIQVNQQYRGGHIYLFYITDGSSPSNATMVHPYAKSAIEAYIVWQYKANRRTYSPGEAEAEERRFVRSRKRLVSRLSGLTMTDIRRAIV